MLNPVFEGRPSACCSADVRMSAQTEWAMERLLRERSRPWSRAGHALYYFALDLDLDDLDLVWNAGGVTRRESGRIPLAAGPAHTL